jgi:hypothetical protein
VFLIELADRMDETHGRLTAVHDHYALEIVIHKVLDPHSDMAIH